MSALVRTGIVVFLISAGVPAALAGPSFVSSNGQELPAPEISGLDCAKMQALLDQYADSGYRGIDPIPASHDDHPIYTYEDLLARAHYAACQSKAVHFEDTSEAFELGFN